MKNIAFPSNESDNRAKVDLQLQLRLEKNKSNFEQLTDGPTDGPTDGHDLLKRYENTSKKKFLTSV